MKLLFRHAFLTLVILFLSSRMSVGEGTRELQPDSLLSSAGLYITNWTLSDYTQFGVINCLPNYRLYIHIKEAGESILFGLKSPVNLHQFNLRKPDGAIVMSGTCPQPGQTGYIQYYSQAIVGPFPLFGGYTPLQYTVTNSADTGNYYFEISTTYTYASIIFDLWDFQVVSDDHTPAVPEDMIYGRVWSQAWQVYADLGYPTHEFNGRFFVYSDDGIVTKLKFQQARVGAATIFCNPYGCYNTGNFLMDRQSVNTNTFLTFPEIADYRVFLNNPDTSLYPSGEYGEIIGTPEMIQDPAFPPCSDPKLILVNVNKSGNIDLELVFPYGFPTTTVNLFSPVSPGLNEITWNGHDGQDNPVPDGTAITVTVTFADGLTNLPIWDQETNPDGFIISLVRPVNPNVQTPMTFWDDSLLVSTSFYCPVSPQSINLEGCTPGSIPGYPGCHPWGLNEPDCHNKMINTWWYGSSSTAMFTTIFYSTPPEPVGHGDSRCGPGTVTLHATVRSTETVDWYDMPVGGIRLLAGDTTFVTPVIDVTTIYYAEARSDSTDCISPVRVPVVATILPAPLPTITGSDTACAGTSGHIYLTEPEKTYYKWWITSGGVITSGVSSNAVTVSWVSPGEQALFVTYTDTNGCPAADPTAFQVFVFPVPDSAGPVYGPSPVCTGSEDVIYTVEPILHAQTYTWIFPSGFIITSGSGTNSITVNISPDAATGEITVYGSNICGDGARSPPFPVIIAIPPVANAGPDETICGASPHPITGATASDYSYLQWLTDGMGVIEGDTTLTPTYIPGPGETGIVTFTLIAGNPPCEDDTSRRSLVILQPTEANAGPDILSCVNIPVIVSDASAASYTSLLWSTSGGGTFNDPTRLHPVYFPSNEDVLVGSVNLLLTGFAIQPCEDVQDTMMITFSKAAQVDAGPDDAICTGTTFQVTNATARHITSLLWLHNGIGTLEETSTLTPVYYSSPGESGFVTLVLTARGESACMDSIVSDQMTIKIYPELIVDAGPNKTIEQGTTTLLQGIVKSGSGEYLFSWEPAGLLLDPLILQPVTINLISDTTFTLTVDDVISGCSGTDSMRIHVKSGPDPSDPECLELYNVITPNGDGVNDTWIIECIEQYPENSVQIFNRWGDQINSFKVYDNTFRVWDGTNSRGETVPDGTYYYVLTIKEMERMTGWIFVRGGSK